MLIRHSVATVVDSRDRYCQINNINIEYRGGGKKVKKPYREQGTNYPEPKFAGPTPAYGLFARHVDGLDVRHVRFWLKKDDERPAILLDDVKNDHFEDVLYPGKEK